MDQWWVHRVFEQQGVVPLVSWIVWVILSITLHELGHGIAAIKQGDTTPRDTGHMTWNPLVHMGQMSLIVFAIFGIAWGLMPVDPSRFRSKHGDAIVSLAGPAVNLALALLCLIALPIWIWIAGGHAWSSIQADDTLVLNMKQFLFYGAFLNIALFLFNLVPILPLDGGHVAAHYSYKYREFANSENGQWIMLGAFFILFYVGGRTLFSVSYTTAHTVAEAGVRVLAPEAIPVTFSR